MIEVLRDIGYSLEAAVVDILDNSLTAPTKSAHRSNRVGKRRALKTTADG